ncbi:MAG: hypothetical protein LBV61_08145 [Burkholderiaceae bacterium]|jgi:ElaB/YqjD/DUF883 family membrane-anchored ribosome-binding protein|nr:hypothetical protein [Burkholderiaceae bacterium]
MDTTESSTAADSAVPAHAYAQHAVNASGQKVNVAHLDRETQATVEQVTARMQEAMRSGLRSVSETRARAQRRLEEAAERTGRYVAEQPMRSMLIAAAAGAAITALLVLVTRRSGD